MKKLIQTFLVVGMLIIPALSYLGDYNDPNDHSKYNDHGWIMQQQRQQNLEYEQEKLWDQMVMDALENEKRQTQVFENQENITKKLKGTKTESQDSYDSVCPFGSCA